MIGAGLVAGLVGFAGLPDLVAAILALLLFPLLLARRPPLPARGARRTAMTACPLCGGSTEAAFTTTDRNRAITAEPFRYRRCTACRSLHLENVPDDLGPYYPAEYFSLPDLEGLRAQAMPERWRMELVAAHATPPGRLTEIGPGNGIFAIQALDAGFEVAAIEVDDRACAYLA